MSGADRGGGEHRSFAAFDGRSGGGHIGLSSLQRLRELRIRWVGGGDGRAVVVAVRGRSHDDRLKSFPRRGGANVSSPVFALHR
jgi:hypothetical protein